MSALSLCIATGKMLVVIPVASFTLAWTHSIEKTRWEEDWQIAGGHLSIGEARVSGSGAGMEPGSDAVLRDGVWHYHPATPPTARLHWKPAMPISYRISAQNRRQHWKATQMLCSALRPTRCSSTLA